MRGWFISVALFLVSVVAYAAPPTQSVTVTNTPLPVTVQNTVGVTGTVGVSGTVSTNCVNCGMAAPTEARFFTIGCQEPAGSTTDCRSGGNTLNAPAGKVIHIANISFRIEAAGIGGTESTCYVALRAQAREGLTPSGGPIQSFVVWISGQKLQMPSTHVCVGQTGGFNVTSISQLWVQRGSWDNSQDMVAAMTVLFSLVDEAAQ